MRLLYLANLFLFCSVVFAENSDFVDTPSGRRATGYIGTGDSLGLPYDDTATVAYPDTFDWREQGFDLPDVKDQGSCGSCWSFAITSSLESAYAIFLKKTIDLSEQHAVSCDARSFGCNGGFMDSANFFVRNGVTDESSFPYKARDVSCRSGLRVKARASSYTLLGGRGRKPTVDEIKSALVQHGPLFITVMAGGDGWVGLGPRVKSCRKRGTTNHMINLVGYTKTDWIIKNSWGKSWADGGYSRIGIGCDLVAEEAGFVSVE
jgi:C1A family cysteine protease